MFKFIILFLKTYIAKRKLLRRQKKRRIDESLAENYTLKPDCKADDAVTTYFCAHNTGGESFVLRLSERAEGKCIAWFGYKDKGAISYIGSRQLSPAVECPLNIFCEQTGKWDLRYSDKTLINKEGAETLDFKTFATTFEGVFEAESKILEKIRDAGVKAQAKAIASEKWTKEFRKKVKGENYITYTQFGRIRGSIQINKDKKEIELAAFKARTLGKSEYSEYNSHLRYSIVLENGDYLEICAGRYPHIRWLLYGYYYSNKKVQAIADVTNINQLLYEGMIPKSWDFLVEIESGRKLVVKAEKETEFVFSLDNDNYTVYEGLAKFTINGLKARGSVQLGNRRKTADILSLEEEPKQAVNEQDKQQVKDLEQKTSKIKKSKDKDKKARKAKENKKGKAPKKLKKK